MKRIIIAIALAIVAVSTWIHSMDAKADLGQYDSSVVVVRNYGGRTYSVLTNVIAKLGSNPTTLLIDGGTWPITNSMSIATNFNLFVATDSTLELTTDIVFTVEGYISSGDWKIFSGYGVATGRCANPFVYDWPEQTPATYLGPLYSSISTNTVEWITNYVTAADVAAMTVTTNWVTNWVPSWVNGKLYVDGLSMTNYVESVLTNYALTSVLSNYVDQVGGTAMVVTVLSSNFPCWYTALSANTDADYANGGYRPLTNLSVITERVGAWNVNQKYWKAKKRGMYLWIVEALVDVNAAVSGVQIFVRKNNTTTDMRLLDDYKTGIAAETFGMNGSTLIYVNDAAITNFYNPNIYYFGGVLTNTSVRVFIQYMGDADITF